MLSSSAALSGQAYSAWAGRAMVGCCATGVRSSWDTARTISRWMLSERCRCWLSLVATYVTSPLTILRFFWSDPECMWLLKIGATLNGMSILF